jgi:hypothetical protein
MNSRKAGRPTLGEAKLVQRAITSDPEIEEFLRKNPSINASDVFRKAIRGMMPRDSDSIRLSKLSEEISDLRARLSIKEAEYESLRKRVEERERIQLDLRLERDCHAWYLRSLEQTGVFRIINSEAVDPVQFVESEISTGSIKKYEVQITDGKARLTDKASQTARRMLKHFLHGDVLEPIPARTWIVPSLENLRSSYGISIDFEKFQDDFLAGRTSGDLPLEYFQRYKPAIINDSIKAEIKHRMEPQYRTVLLDTGDAK